MENFKTTKVKVVDCLPDDTSYLTEEQLNREYTGETIELTVHMAPIPKEFKNITQRQEIDDTPSIRTRILNFSEKGGWQIQEEMNIGRSIRECRKQRNMSQKELALSSGLTQSAISQIESGQRPTEYTMTCLSRALNLSIPYILIQSLEDGDIPLYKKDVWDQLKPTVLSILFENVK